MNRNPAIALAVGGVLVVIGLAILAVNRSPPSPLELRVLAGSSLTDPKFRSILDDLREETGVTLDLEPVRGTLAGAEQIACGTRRDIDAAWFPADDYLKLFCRSQNLVVAAKPVMRSPVVIGLKPSAAEDLREEYGEDLTWEDIALASQEGKLRFAMTDPVKSNSGFDATLAVASTGRGGPLRVEGEVVTSLEGFYKGQEVIADSSRFLVDAYRRNQKLMLEEDRVDGMINYESVLLSEFSRSELEIIYPRDGVVLASHPLVLLSKDADKRAAYERALDWLLTSDVQRRIMDRTARRPVTPDPPPDPARFPALPGVIERPDAAATEALLTRSTAILSQPNRSIFVLDTSESMNRPGRGSGSRLDELKAAINGLTGSDPSLAGDLAGELARFRKSEEVVLIPFATVAKRPARFTLYSADPDGSAQRDIRVYVNALSADGATATYDGLLAAFKEAAAAPDRTNIVLLSDGKKTRGTSLQSFLDERPPATHYIPVRAIQFGDASESELKELAEHTDGEVYDANAEDLGRVLRRIRLGL